MGGRPSTARRRPRRRAQPSSSRPPIPSEHRRSRPHSRQRRTRARPCPCSLPGAARSPIVHSFLSGRWWHCRCSSWRAWSESSWGPARSLRVPPRPRLPGPAPRRQAPRPQPLGQARHRPLPRCRYPRACRPLFLRSQACRRRRARRLPFIPRLPSTLARRHLSSRARCRPRCPLFRACFRSPPAFRRPSPRRFPASFPVWPQLPLPLPTPPPEAGCARAARRVLRSRRRALSHHRAAPPARGHVGRGHSGTSATSGDRRRGARLRARAPACSRRYAAFAALRGRGGGRKRALGWVLGGHGPSPTPQPTRVLGGPARRVDPVRVDRALRALSLVGPPAKSWTTGSRRTSRGCTSRELWATCHPGPSWSAARTWRRA